ncbi:MAG: hypothetical protein A3J69_00720 [Candidatus Levybacteria bacterium RIFCSPHIGHO2_02_FULL_42_12]|nr:MAG: hypothetical protein A3J69_00720 [Candidatus Levybacteria bacterium RIFCSPHIGHO2_02_FULL_42_12]OGH43067.1 MAG: hypothetical protein A3B53_03070 [Candidatus Levybacteria bacterium RIFCSPLOWO2_01_FULL_42_15]
MITKRTYIVRDFLKNSYIRIAPRLKEEELRKATMLSFTFIAVALFGFFAVSPTLSTITQLRKQLSDSKAVYVSIKQKNANLSTLQQKYNALGTDLPFIFSALPQDPAIAVFVGQLQTLFTNNRISVSLIQVEELQLLKKDITHTYASFAFTFTAKGTNEDVARLLANLVEFERIVTIENVSIASLASQNEKQITLSGKAYFKK